jgi:hypothetical protein
MGPDFRALVCADGTYLRSGTIGAGGRFLQPDFCRAGDASSFRGWLYGAITAARHTPARPEVFDEQANLWGHRRDLAGFYCRHRALGVACFVCGDVLAVEEQASFDPSVERRRLWRARRVQ